MPKVLSCKIDRQNDYKKYINRITYFFHKVITEYSIMVAPKRIKHTITPSAVNNGGGRKRKGALDSGDIIATLPLPAITANIHVIIEETEPGLEETIEAVTVENGIINTVLQSEETSKKRGRKPKGGKLSVKQASQIEKPPPIPNVILHLKCTFKDLHEYNAERNKLVTNPLNYNADVPPEIKTYSATNLLGQSFSVYDETNGEGGGASRDYAYSEPIRTKFSASTEQSDDAASSVQLCKDCGTNIHSELKDGTHVQLKEVQQKLKKLKVNLYKNSMSEKKSACFWCTYEFDNQVCYIPKYEMDGVLSGYGSFCRPECAVGFLMKENIDDSSKFERYHLLNQLYGKVYEYKNNIKPAPNPYYLLDKFYGNLSIQEYRRLLNTEHILLVIDKPLSRILPELHEDTDDFVTGIYGGSKGAATQAGGVYKVKRQSEKQQGPSKSSIIMDKFGLTQ
jgi:hypothetical protein